MLQLGSIERAFFGIIFIGESYAKENTDLANVSVCT